MTRSARFPRGRSIRTRTAANSRAPARPRLEKKNIFLKAIISGAKKTFVLVTTGAFRLVFPHALSGPARRAAAAPGDQAREKVRGPTSASERSSGRGRGDAQAGRGRRSSPTSGWGRAGKGPGRVRAGGGRLSIRAWARGARPRDGVPSHPGPLFCERPFSTHFLANITFWGGSAAGGAAVAAAPTRPTHPAAARRHSSSRGAAAAAPSSCTARKLW